MRISVCMATYNGAEFIKQQLDSILSQLATDDEVIISDDSSSDATVEIINSFADDRIRLFEGRKFSSPIRNFEFAIQQAKNPLIFLADQDDVWTDSKVDILRPLLSKYDVVVSDCSVVDKDLKIVTESFFSLNNSGPGLLKNLKSNSYLGCCMAFNQKVKHLILPFPKQIPMHDIWIGFVGELFFKTKFVKERLILYRRHGNNESPTAEKSPYSLFQKIKFRTSLVFRIPKLLLKYYS
ncbi:Spore coat polysaccharide biosynthesis protein spsA [Sphingobacterium spiritivorum]|uniref:Spore coat polysaccharide biosynthesis protein spsA n=1 Tax=Sphingobacterium spiritivorum TaxID=258 RepID=A0A380C691_SPHSI|nr:glycosyltransferase [Sphingobacterium spiritivorum]SUJ12982.1 Spore coat polysaccharide biosynthesis protein spsA [Sphingobacterium spiritivorum]